MTQQLPGEGEKDDQDRTVSRRVDHPTTAEPGDEAVYQAAHSGSDDDPGTGSSDGTPGASSTDAAAEIAADDESEPDRSE